MSEGHVGREAQPSKRRIFEPLKLDDRNLEVMLTQAAAQQHPLLQVTDMAAKDVKEAVSVVEDHGTRDG